jgi:tight adherence protein B
MGTTMQAFEVLADSGIGTGVSILLGLAVGGGVALLFVGLQRAIDGHTTSMSRRLDEFVNYNPLPMAAPAKKGRRQRRVPSYNPSEQGRGREGYSLKLARELARADLKITVGEFMVLTAVLASLGALVGYAIPIGGHVVLALVLFGAGIYGPRWYVGSKRRSRQAKFNGQLADVIAIMSGALRSGFSLLQSMELVAREGPEPVSKEFERVVREVGLGLSPEEALANLVERMQSEDLELLVTAINVQREVGGNLVEVLDTIASTIRERVKLVGQVRVLTAQQQFSGYIIALLPVVLALILGIINPTYMLGIFSKTTYCGWTLLGCSSISVLSGFLVIRKIVDIKV